MAKRGENIHKRKDGRWEGRYIKGRTAEGKPVWGYLYGYAYREVREELIKQKALSGFYQLSGKSMRFSELAELWLASLRQGIYLCSLPVYSAQISSSSFRQFTSIEHDGFFAGTSFSSNFIALRPESQATWRILGTGMFWDATANLQVCCTSAPHAAHRDMRQTATHTEARTTTLNPDRTGFSPGISFIRTNHP